MLYNKQQIKMRRRTLMKKLSIKKGVQCMACLECVRACSNAYYKEFHPDKAALKIVQRGDQLILYSDIVGPKQLGEVMEKFPHRVLYNALGRPYFSLRVQKGESPLVLLRDVVTLLPGAQNQPQTKP
jgi:ferredoxin